MLPSASPVPGAVASDPRCDSLSRSLLESTPSPVVFCHNDCQEGKNCCLFREAGCACVLGERRTRLK